MGLKLEMFLNVQEQPGATEAWDHYTNHHTWGCFVARDFDTLDNVNEIMNKEDYLQILQHDLKSTARWLKMGLGWMFQQDKDPKRA